MKPLLLMLALALLTLPVVTLALSLVNHVRLRNLREQTSRLDALERRVKQLTDGSAGARVEEAATPERSSERDTPTVGAPAPAGAPRTPTPPRSPVESVKIDTDDIERQYGTRVVVWLGGIALAMAGAFLVKYSIDRGWLGPAVRVSLAVVFGLGLLGCSGWIRARSESIAQGCAASGIAVLFAAVLAGVNLYGLFSPALGFAAMALITATAVVLALRYGQLVAVLGLLGGFFTPQWIGTDDQHPWVLLSYLLLLQGGLFFVSRQMRWWPLAGLTLLGALGWGAVWIGNLETLGGGTPAVGSLLLLSVASAVFAARSGADGWGYPKVAEGLTWAGTGVGTVLLAALVGVADFGWTEWAFLALLGTGCLTLGRLDPKYEGLAWLAALVPAAMLWVWGLDLGPEERTRFWSIAAAFLGLWALASYVAMWGSVKPFRWAALAGASGVVYLLTAYAGLSSVAWPLPFGLQALVLAAMFAVLGHAVYRGRGGMADGDETFAAYAVAVTTLVSLAVPMELERAWITVAWALEIPLLAWIVRRLRVPQLEKAAWALGFLVATRLLLNPAVLEYPLGDGIVLNGLLYGYGVPIVAFALGCTWFRRQGREPIAEALEAGAMAFGLVWITLEIRQFFHPGNLGAGDFRLAEWGAWPVFWALYGLGLLEWARLSGRRAPRVLGAGTLALALAVGLTQPCLLQNPLWTSHAVGGTPVFNLLLFVYGVPAVLALLAARRLERSGETRGALVAGSAALLYAFTTVSLQVRQAFHGTWLDRGATSDAEMYTYSLLWILFATALLVGGILTRGHVLRYGSAAVMTLAVGKVFLLDTGNLTGLYRVFSLFGLGVSLMVLAYLYQRFVFAESSPDERLDSVTVE
jgi:uncharacterized membrane protein